MKRIFLAGILGVLCAFQFVANADDKRAVKIPIVTRDNFVSFQYSTYKGLTDASNHVRLEGNMLRAKTSRAYSTGGRETPAYLFDIWDQTAALSNSQLQAFIKILNEAKLPMIVGKYRDKSLADGLNEYLMLTISDAQNRDQKFVIQNYGQSAPREYFKVVEALRGLQAQKFPVINSPAQTGNSDLVTRQNLQMLTLETSGGFAGIKSLLEVRVPPATSSDGRLILHWSESIGMRNTNRDETLTPSEEGELLRLINAASLHDLNGKSYTQPELADGFNETLTLKLNYTQTFVVHNYGDKAPAEYFALTAFLRALQQKKFTAETR